jgi:hypothetical protein
MGEKSERASLCKKVSKFVRSSFWSEQHVRMLRSGGLRQAHGDFSVTENVLIEKENLVVDVLRGGGGVG